MFLSRTFTEMEVGEDRDMKRSIIAELELGKFPVTVATKKRRLEWKAGRQGSEEKQI